MPASLRKACHACTLAKRQCRPQLPKCSRCLKNVIACIYDLEPLTHIVSTLDQPFSGTESLKDRDVLSDVAQASYSMFNTVTSAQQAAIEAFGGSMRGSTPPEIRMVADEETLKWLVSQLLHIPDLMLQNRPPPFIHAQVYCDREDRTARLEPALRLHQTLSEEPSGDVDALSPARNVHLQRLIESNVTHLPLSDVLILINELALFLIIYLFHDVPSSYKAEAEQHLDLLINWTNCMWSAIPGQLSNKFSNWEAWLIAESARRSMIASYFIQGGYLALKHGYCIFRPFLESLPFDARSGLWEATSEQAWQSAVVIHGGELTVLVSFREFIESSFSGDLSHILQGQGMFERMLLVAFHGRKALEMLS